VLRDWYHDPARSGPAVAPNRHRRREIRPLHPPNRRRGAAETKAPWPVEGSWAIRFARDASRGRGWLCHGLSAGRLDLGQVARPRAAAWAGLPEPIYTECWPPGRHVFWAGKVNIRHFLFFTFDRLCAPCWTPGSGDPALYCRWWYPVSLDRSLALETHWSACWPPLQPGRGRRGAAESGSETGPGDWGLFTAGWVSASLSLRDCRPCTKSLSGPPSMTVPRKCHRCLAPSLFRFRSWPDVAGPLELRIITIRKTLFYHTAYWPDTKDRSSTSNHRW